MIKKSLLLLTVSLLFVAACAGFRAMGGEGIFTGGSDRSGNSADGTLLTAEGNSNKFFGFWDHPSLPDTMLPYVNTGKSLAADDTRTVTRSGLPVIPIISGFSSEDSPEEWRRRLRNKSQQIPGSDEVPFVLLIDEPYSKGWDDDKLEQLVDIAHDIMPEHKFAFTVMTLTILHRPQRRLPQNADYIGINYYPFRIGSTMNSEQRFRRDMNRLMNAARNKIDTRFFIVGQAFYDDDKWHQPPDESPLWYANAIAETEDIDGLLWFEWKNRSNWKGAGSMPAYLENLKKAGTLFEQDWR